MIKSFHSKETEKVWKGEIGEYVLNGLKEMFIILKLLIITK
jgi:hypothetical protein